MGRFGQLMFKFKYFDVQRTIQFLLSFNRSKLSTIRKTSGTKLSKIMPFLQILPVNSIARIYQPYLLKRTARLVANCGFQPLPIARLSSWRDEQLSGLFSGVNLIFRLF